MSGLSDGQSASGPRLATERLRALVEHFERTFAKHGPTAKGVDWRGASEQTKRIEILVAELLTTPTASVCDLGCGYGALLDALRAGGFTGTYTGVDISSALIDAARARCADDPDSGFRVGVDPRPADYVVACGIFSLRLDTRPGDWQAHIDATLGRMVAAATRGVLVNFLLPGTLPQATPHLHFDDPDRIRALLHEAGAAKVRIVTRPGLLDFTAVARVGPAGS